MEDAYTELFREFLGLRSVCLKQAALLRQLTDTLQKHPVASDPSGETAAFILAQRTQQQQQQSPSCCALHYGGPGPIPPEPARDPTGQHHHGGPGPLQPPPPAMTARNPTGRHHHHHGANDTAGRGPLCDLLTAGRGPLCDLLTEDMKRLGLGLGVAHDPKQDVAVKHGGGRDSSGLKASPSSSSSSSASSSCSSASQQHARRACASARDSTLQAFRPLASYRALLDGGGFLSPAVGEDLMSELTLQSHVCDFCQAVFPGDTTTRGEFVRHLHTHIT